MPPDWKTEWLDEWDAWGDWDYDGDFDDVDAVSSPVTDAVHIYLEEKCIVCLLDADRPTIAYTDAPALIIARISTLMWERVVKPELELIAKDFQCCLEYKRGDACFIIRFPKSRVTLGDVRRT